MFFQKSSKKLKIQFPGQKYQTRDIRWELLEEAHQQWLEDIIADANDPDYDLLQNQGNYNTHSNI